MNMLIRTSLVAMAVAAAVDADAGRPLVTEDAGVLAAGECEVESYASRFKSRGEPKVSGGSLQFGCGVGLGTQVALAATAERSAGLTDRGVALVGKTALNAPQDGAAAYALAWGLVATRARGASYKHEDSFINGALTWPLNDALKLHANLGWSRSQSARQSSTGWALAVEHETTSAWSLLAETFASDRDRSPWVQLAARWTVVPERLFLDGSWGLQTSGQRPRQITLGLKAAF
ncbi:MAG: hypothetical protein IH627_06030 [Rubrivivax sp.]|nr:hypothetical protein [Rubrivivax sp.]